MSDPSGTYRLVRDSIIALVVIVFFVGVVALIIWPGLVQEAQALIATDTPVPTATTRARPTAVAPATGEREPWSRAERAAIVEIRSLGAQSLAYSITYVGWCQRSENPVLTLNLPISDVCVVMHYADLATSVPRGELLAITEAVRSLAVAMKYRLSDAELYVNVLQTVVMPEGAGELAGVRVLGGAQRISVAEIESGFETGSIGGLPPAEPWMWSEEP